MKTTAITAALMLVGGSFVIEGGRSGWSLLGVARAVDPKGSVAPRWAVDPARPGPNLPPQGRSLFDFIALRRSGGAVVQDIPYPFPMLVERIEKLAGCSKNASCTRQVLIPLGRSLQRGAASPDFFDSPRVVLAVDREGDAQQTSVPLLKDRLYLGYQSRAALIEVISYNELAGRFEFQLVKDYREGGTPTLVYASRDVCSACHQNQAPLFSRQQWDETNANPEIAARLGARGQLLYGVPIHAGVAVPNAIDDATERANMLAVYQLLWREGCGASDATGARCRVTALSAALRYALSGERGFQLGTFTERSALPLQLRRQAKARWAGGLAIPSPDIPNRDPFALDAKASGRALSHVPAQLEALVPRAPLEVWRADDPQLPQRFVAGLAAMLSAADVREIDARLSRLVAGSRAPRRSFTGKCRKQTVREELRFECTSSAPSGASLDGHVTLHAGRVDSGQLESLALTSEEPLTYFDIREGRVQRTGDEEVLSFSLSSRGLHARLPNGHAIERIELRGPKAASTATVTVTTVDDFEPLRAALEAIADAPGAGADDAPLAASVFDRTRIMGALAAALGLPARRGCCAGEAALPPARENLGTAAAEVLPPTAQIFGQHCVPCHQTPEPSPPNFLYGDPARVNAALLSCAPRILVRLGMWAMKPQARVKTPMPPPLASHDGSPIEHETAPDAAILDALRATTTELLRAQPDGAATLDALVARGYENLRPCLPAGP